MLTAQQHWLIDLGIHRSPCAIDEPKPEKQPRRKLSERTTREDKDIIRQRIVDELNKLSCKIKNVETLYDQMTQQDLTLNSHGNYISEKVFQKLYTEAMQSGQVMTPRRIAKHMILSGKSIEAIMKKTALCRGYINEIRRDMEARNEHT